jgi:hypothetical protein
MHPQSTFPPSLCHPKEKWKEGLLSTRGPIEISRDYILSIVLLLPPAPAARVLLGLAFATLSARSAAAFLLIADLGPPGGAGDDGRALLPVATAPVAVLGVTGEAGLGDDWYRCQQCERESWRYRDYSRGRPEEGCGVMDNGLIGLFVRSEFVTHHYK